MNDAKSAEFACDRCGKRFRWTRSLATSGRPVRCPCGNVLRVPVERPEHAEVHAEEHLHHVQASSADAQHAHHAAPDHATPGSHVAVLHGAHPVSHHVAPEHPSHSAVAVAPAPHSHERQESSSDQFDPETLKNFYMPLYFLIGGVVIDMAVAYFRSPSLGEAARQLLFGLVGTTVVMLIAMLLAAKFRGLQLGSLSAAVLKLAAITVAPGALGVLISIFMQGLLPTPLLGSMVSMLAEFVLFFALLGVFFDLDQSDTWYCMGVMIVIFIAMFFVGKALGIH
jgi:DNA-directed RNA polymerase subunit RPC12/RpoP